MILRNALVLALLLGTSGALAGSRSAMKKHLAAGQSLFDAGNYAQALAEFEAARAENATPESIGAVARTLEKLGRPVKAAEAWLALLAAKPRAKERAEAEERLNADLEMASHLDLRANLKGAKVSVDGTAVGATPIATTLDLDPGTHSVVLEKEGWMPITETVTIQPGQTAKVEFPDEPPPVAEAPSPPPPPVAAVSATTPAKSPDRSGPGMAASKKAGIALIVTGVAVAGAGGALFALGKSSFSGANGESTLDARNSAVDKAHSFETIGMALLGVGGAALVGGIIAAAIPRRTERSASLWISPTANGVMAGGTF